MYSACLVCRSAFPESTTLGTLSRGDRFAYDLEQGRLWVICRSCHRWNLVPLEERWEALEELEALVLGGAPLRHKTQHISLFRMGSLDIVRIGDSDLAEEAWWRYGRPLSPAAGPRAWFPALFRRMAIASLAWVGEKACPRCGFPFRDIRYNDWKILVVKPKEDGFSLLRPCPQCKDPVAGGLHLKGLEAELTLARLTAFQNLNGESRVTVQAAARLVSDVEGPMRLMRLLTRHGKPLGSLQPIGLTALEITVNAAREKTLLKLDAEALQTRWRREEELASLVDGELTPVGGLEALKKKFGRRP